MCCCVSGVLASRAKGYWGRLLLQNAAPRDRPEGRPRASCSILRCSGCNLWFWFRVGGANKVFPPPPCPGLGLHTEPCEPGNGSLPPSLTQLGSRAGLVHPLPGLTAIGCLRTFRPDLHVALQALRAFLFTSLQSAGQPDASSPRLQQQALGHPAPKGVRQRAG